MWRFLLLLSSIPLVLADPVVTCTNGYTLVNNKCLKVFSEELTYKEAQRTCGSVGGTLVLSKNAIDNSAITSFVGTTVRKFWMGVYCLGNDYSSCFFDDQNGSVSSYNKFASGFPYVAFGNCVYFSTTGSSAGKWYSTDCEEEIYPFVCELPTTFEDTCEYNYNGHCYFTSQSINDTLILPYNRAQAFCELYGANLASIHSAAELRFIGSFLYWWFGPTTIGGVKSLGDSFYWTDGTPWDYSYSSSEQAVGCVIINFPGFWETKNCETPLPFLCKRPAGGSPAPSIVPITVAPFPTNSPSCNTSILLTPAQITSPNYPNNYDNSITCSYSIATIGPSRIKMNIISFITQNEDYLYLYDGDSEDSRSLGYFSGQLNAGMASMYSMESSGNRMYLVFKTDGSNTDLGFHIKFDYTVQ